MPNRPKLSDDAVLAIRAERDVALRERRRPRLKPFCREHQVASRTILDAAHRRTYRWLP